jgi:hypothetical protein
VGVTQTRSRQSDRLPHASVADSDMRTANADGDGRAPRQVYTNAR